MTVRRLVFDTFVDDRGCLIPIEYANPELPFVPVRSFGRGAGRDQRPARTVLKISAALHRERIAQAPLEYGIREVAIAVKLLLVH